MMIVEAIQSTHSEHAVYFLLTAYLESLRHFERSAGVPAGVLRLPVRDSGDLHDRLALLDERMKGERNAIVPVNEARDVIECAIGRLAALAGTAPGPILRAA